MWGVGLGFGLGFGLGWGWGWGWGLRAHAGRAALCAGRERGHIRVRAAWGGGQGQEDRAHQEPTKGGQPRLIYLSRVTCGRGVRT